MSAARNRKHRRLQPYAWLGAGAVTIGMGTALLGGAAVAFADIEAGGTTTNISDTSTSDTSAAPATPAAKTDAAPHRKSRVSRANTGASGSVGESSDAPASSSAVRQRASVAAPVPAAAVDTVPGQLDEVAAPVVAETVAPARVARRAAALPETVADWLAPKAAATRAAAALVSPPTPAPPSSLAPNYNVSWLPGGTCSSATACVTGLPPGPITPATSTLPQIVPGSYVAQARDEISATQGLIFQETFGKGNIFAGVAALVPELFLATSSLSLGLWSATNEGAQSFLAGTAGIPLIAQIAQVNLLANMMLPAISDFSLGAAGFFLPVVGFLGADITLAAATLESAQQNGKVYSIVPVRTYAGTQPLVNASINGGPNRSLLVDTGASGLLTTADKVDVTGLTPVGEGSINFSGNPGDAFEYSIYEVPVDFGGGAVTGAGSTINVIEDQGDIDRFQDFIFYADGILGVGANSDGPGATPLLTATLPGELKDGMLLFQNFWPLGLGGFMVFGLNPLPVDVSLPGTPDAWIKVGVNGADPIPHANQTPAIIDSGGVFGTIRQEDIGAGQTEMYDPPGPDPAYLAVKPGVKITGYTPDGTKELYSYTTVAGGTPVIGNTADDYMNTGNAAFSQGPVYINYGTGNGTVDYGIGSTDFSIW